ncbi:WAT1-related protein At1g68170-like [Vicia villosa]|uniref:WAT1-related protein At1g68170-like n=1 Tax=Vicia villosa TaxID=3911 RepID=UPI00273B3DC3|nr:WAT1-related protein At1g68170-like [Vicia villosa]
MNTWKILRELKPVVLMVLVQIAYAAANVFYKIATNDGMSIRVVTSYRLIVGAAFSFPLALVLERKNRPKLTRRVLFMSFCCGLFGGSLFQNLFFTALALVSATFASAVYNLIPVITFILAVLCRLERLNMGTIAGKVTILGTITGVVGSMILIFFKGVEINIWNVHINLLHGNQNNNHVGTTNADSIQRIVGVLCGLGSCFSFSLWLIIHTKMCKEYPCYYSSTTLMNLMGAIQATIFALCVEKDLNQWKLGWNFRLLTAAYSGIVTSGLVFIVTAWCVRKKGPVYASAFNPLNLLIVAIAASLLLDETLYVGSVIGGVLIVGGLYMVLWGKSKETNFIAKDFEGSTEVVVMCKTSDHDSVTEATIASPNTRSNSIVT